MYRKLKEISVAGVDLKELHVISHAKFPAYSGGEMSFEFCDGWLCVYMTPTPPVVFGFPSVEISELVWAIPRERINDLSFVWGS